MYQSLSHRQLGRRANTLLRTVRNVPSSSEIIRELAEITMNLEDAPVKPDVVARLTVDRNDGRRTIVEVHTNSTFHSFYHFYSQQGNRRSTKTYRRASWRNEGLMLGACGLEGCALRLARYQSQTNPIVKSQIKIYRKRAYRRLLRVTPDQIWRQS